MRAEIFGRPIAYHRVFVTLTGSLEAAVLLAQACHWQSVRGAGDWWWKTGREWEQETGLNRWHQEAARKTLRGHGWWREEVRGYPAKAHYLVDVDGLAAAVEALPVCESTAKRRTRIQFAADSQTEPIQVRARAGDTWRKF